MNVWDVLITALLLAAVALAIRQLRRSTGCSGHCDRCDKRCK